MCDRLRSRTVKKCVLLLFNVRNRRRGACLRLEVKVWGVRFSVLREYTYTHIHIHICLSMCAHHVCKLARWDSVYACPGIHVYVYVYMCAHGQAYMYMYVRTHVCAPCVKASPDDGIQCAVVCVRAQVVERPVVETHYVDRIVEKEV